MPDPILQAVASGFAISDILAVVIKTTTKWWLMKTATDATAKAALSQATDKELRKGNVILASNQTKDLIKGYDITFKDVLMHPELLSLFTGGTMTTAAEGGAFASFAAPVVGTPPTYEEFSMEIYCGDKDTSGDDKQYLKFTFPQCKGTAAVDIDLKDGDFFSPSYTIKNRPSTGISPMEFAIATTLPAVA